MPSSQAAFKALADPTRRDILLLLLRQDMSIAQVAENFDMTRAAVKKHLTILSDGGLVKTTTHGRERVNSLDPQGIQPVLDWFTYFDGFWDNRLSALQIAIEKDQQ